MARNGANRVDSPLPAVTAQVGWGGCCFVKWVGEAFSLGKLMAAGDRVGIVGECDTSGKLIFSTDCTVNAVNRRNDGLFGVWGRRRRLPDLPTAERSRWTGNEWADPGLGLRDRCSN